MRKYKVVLPFFRQKTVELTTKYLRKGGSPPPLGLSNITGIWFTGVQVKHDAPLTEKNPAWIRPSFTRT